MPTIGNRVNRYHFCGKIKVNNLYGEKKNFTVTFFGRLWNGGEPNNGGLERRWKRP